LVRSEPGKQAYPVDLRLSDANAAPAFAAAHYTLNLFIATWQEIQGSDEKPVTVVQIVLLVGTWLLGMLAISSAARVGLASRRSLLEQLAELDLRRPLGLAGLAEPDLPARQRIGPGVHLHAPGPAR
jgi:hypothetical protein